MAKSRTATAHAPATARVGFTPRLESPSAAFVRTTPTNTVSWTQMATATNTAASPRPSDPSGADSDGSTVAQPSDDPTPNQMAVPTRTAPKPTSRSASHEPAVDRP